MIFLFLSFIENINEINQDQFMKFADLTKSFNIAIWQALLNVLKYLDPKGKTLNVIVSFYKEINDVVISGGESSMSFNVTNGTKQSCVKVSVLF